MKAPQKRGFGFGLVSGIITTLGVMIGLYSVTNSKVAVLGGILSVAVADAFSDSLGIHLSEESSGKVKHSVIWKETFSTFFSKLIFAAIFVIPVFLFELRLAIISGIFLGFVILSIFSYKIAVSRGDTPWKKIFEHVSIAVLVVIVTYMIGKLF